MGFDSRTSSTVRLAPICASGLESPLVLFFTTTDDTWSRVVP